MSLADVTAAVLVVGLTLYAIFAGADFGAGFWDLFARDNDRERVRERIDASVGPVWEANHVWLIFALVITWTAFGEAFSALMTTLFVPLSLAALGIVIRGSGFAFRKVTTSVTGRRAYDWMFSVSSIVTPFFLGTVVGAIASEQVPVPANGSGPLSSWLNPTSILVGVLFVAVCAYVAAVFLSVDSRRAGDEQLTYYFRRRAVFAGVATGALALVGVFVLRSDARYIYDGLVNDALPLVIASVVFGVGAIVLLVRGVFKGVRVLAGGAVATVVWGWAVAQEPYLLPQNLTIAQAAPPHDTLVLLLIVFGIAAVVVAPSLVLLYVLHQRELLSEGEPGETEGS